MQINYREKTDEIREFTRMCFHSYGYTNSNYNTIAQFILHLNESHKLCPWGINVDYRH